MRTGRSAFAGNPAPGDEANPSLREAGSLPGTAPAGVRCIAAPPGRTLLRGMLVPGLGQYSTSSRVVGVAVASLVALGTIESITKLAQSNSLYARYQATHSAQAPQIYNVAQDRRFGAREFAVETGLFWIASAVEAEVQERVHAARIAAERDFWLSPIVVPSSAAGRSGAVAGAALVFRFR